jgi:hypothetical protein
MTSDPSVGEGPTTWLEQLLATQKGVASREQLLTGMSEETLRWRLDSKRWQTATPGVVVAHSGPVSPHQQLWVDLLSCGTGAALAGLTAAGLDGWDAHAPARHQLVVPQGRQVTDRPDLEVHSSTRLGPEHIHPLRAPRRTRLPRSLVDAASWSSTADDARAIIASGVQQRLVRPGDLAVIARAVPNLRWRRLIISTVRDAEGGSHSLPEVELVDLCRRFGLPLPSRQARRKDSRGRWRWLDAWWDDFGLVVEIDGLFHMTATSWWADMWRGNEHTVAREGLMRFPAFAVREQQARVAAQLAAALAARGWTGRLRTPRGMRDARGR